MRRLRLSKVGLFVGAGIYAAAGCSETESKSFIAGVRNANAATVYEGLPHPMSERQALEQELASKATVRLHDYTFYQEPLALSESDERALREIVDAEDTFAPFSGEKRCGGFHPDYCVEWRDNDGEPYRMLVVHSI